jgi:hypothetical protein
MSAKALPQDTDIGGARERTRNGAGDNARRPFHPAMNK